MLKQSLQTLSLATARADLPRSAADIGAVLQSSDVRAVLAALNARTRYRFTGVYRLDPPLLRNVALYDRENPALHLAGNIDTLRDTYCAVPAIGRPLAIADAPSDARFAGHAARHAVQSYLGVPLRLSDGTVWGTLCHFDPRPRLAPDGELAVLEQAAAQLASRLATRGGASLASHVE